MTRITVSSDYKSDKAGVAAVEFALIAPVLIVMFLGIADFGRYLNATLRLENTARAAAEYVVRGGDASNIQSDIVAISNSLSDTEKQQINVTTENKCECAQSVTVMCGSTCSGSDFVRRYIEVSMSMTYEPTFPFPGLPDRIDIQEFVRLQVN